jgi:leader peptidase (prepilin peptidase)/N-methyltransferase
MIIIFITFIFILALVVGSFLANYTYRAPRGISVVMGRSRCPKCKHLISWYDNIPLFSYLILGGKCRNCKGKISPRYFLIEIATAVVFVLIALKFDGVMLVWYLIVSLILISVFVIDWEHQIILDELSLGGFFLAILFFLLTDSKDIYLNLLSGMGFAVVLLFINLITKGKGMGLGDAKLAIFIGTLLGPLNSLGWFLTSFIIGGFFGVVVLLLKKKKLKDKIAFGPFLVIGAFLTILI